MRRTTAAAAISLAILVATAGPALACGGLVNPNGTVSLLRTTTLAAYVDGIEHYITSFEFAGGGAEFGSIIPLPGVPTDVRRAGDWTLQRLVEEVRPPLDLADDGEQAFVGASLNAEVLIETKIDALDITVVKGGGDEVGAWAKENGFVLTPDAPEILDHYAARSPIFMAARFNVERAARLDQAIGQGTPIHLEIPTDHPWVPLRILGLGREAAEPIEADVFLLTEEAPLLAPAPAPAGSGLLLERSEPASGSLLADLRSDKGMRWLPEDDMWFTYLRIDSDAGELTYDLNAFVGVPPELDAASPGDRGGGPLDGWLWSLIAVPLVGLALFRVANRVADRL